MKTQRLCEFTLIGISLLTFSAIGRADSTGMTASLGQGGQNAIAGLSLTSPDADHRFEERGIMGVAHARYAQKQAGWTLSGGSDLVTTDGSHENWDVNIPVPLSGTHNRLELTAVGPQGQIQKQDLLVEAPNWDDLSRESEEKGKRKISFYAGLRLESDNLSDPRDASADVFGLGVKAGAQMPFGLTSIFAKIDAAITAVATSSNSLNYREFDADALLGYHLSNTSEWHPYVELGGIYSTILTSDGALGYNNVFGGTLRLGINHALMGESFLGFEIGAAPIFGNSFLLSLGSHELHAQLDYGSMLAVAGHPIIFSLGADSLRFVSDGIGVTWTDVTLGASIGF